MNEIKIRVEAEIKSTEDPEKVRLAVENIIWDAKFHTKTKKCGSLLIAEARGKNGLTTLYDLLKRDRIRDAARRVLLRGLGERSITFYLNKQVAYTGHASFSEPIAESPLGPIKVHIRCNNPEEVVEWLTSKTRET